MTRILTEEEQMTVLVNLCKVQPEIQHASLRAIDEAILEAKLTAQDAKTKAICDRENAEAIQIAVEKNNEQWEEAMHFEQVKNEVAIQQAKRDTAKETAEMSIDFYAMIPGDFKRKYGLSHFKGEYVFSEVVRAKYLPEG